MLVVVGLLYEFGPKYEHRVYTKHVEQTVYQVEGCQAVRNRNRCDWLNDNVFEVAGARWATKAAAQRFLRKPHPDSFYKNGYYNYNTYVSWPIFHRIVPVDNSHTDTRHTTRRLPAWERIGKTGAEIWAAIVGSKEQPT